MESTTGLHHVHANPYQVLANLLALAAVCPFVGSLSDLIGRRYVALSGAFFVILGMVVASTAHSMNIFICERHPLIPRPMKADRDRRHDICRYRRRDQRTDRAGRHIRASTHAETRKIRRRVDIHHSAIRAKCAVGSIDCGAFKLEVLRCSVWCLGRGGVHHDGNFLSSPAEGKFAGFDEEGNSKPDRLRGGVSQRLGNAVVHGW